MSELKYYKLFHRASALTSPEFISIVEFGKDDEVYLKSEADKVIAEIKAQKAKADDDCVLWKKKYNDCKRELDLLKDTNAFYNGGR